MANVIATIPGQHISASRKQLPDAATAPDQLHYAKSKCTLPDSGRVRFTFNRFRRGLHRAIALRRDTKTDHPKTRYHH